jgi:type VI secretion system protein ImpL
MNQIWPFIQQIILSRLGQGAVVFIILTLLVGTAYQRGWLGAVIASPWFWIVLGLLLLIAIFCAIRFGIPWWREQQFLKRQGSEYLAAGQQSPEELRAKFLFALQTLKGLPQLKGGTDPVYALPWYLLIGEPAAGKTASIRAADLFSPLTAQATEEGPTQNFDWWVSNNAVVVDTSGRYTTPADVARDRSEWYRLLRLIREHRSNEPINGLIIAVAAETLLSQADEALRAMGTKYRERIEEIVRELGIDFPVYLLITKSDQIEGFREFFAQLPERVFTEAIGYVDDPPAPLHDGEAKRGAAALQRLNTGLEMIYKRLHQFRLSILEGKAPMPQRPAIYCFPEEVKALEHPLGELVEPIFNEDVRFHTPFLRGVFVTSGRQQGRRFSLLRRALHVQDDPSPVVLGDRSYFLHDVFNLMLPRDRGLVGTTARERRRRSLTTGAGLVIGIGALVVLGAVVLGGFMRDWQIARAADPAVCAENPTAGSARAAIEGVEKCRSTVDQLMAANRRGSTWRTLGFSRARDRERELVPLYTRKFRKELLAPLDADLERSFERAQEPLPLLLLLARRVHLARRCVSPSGCPDQTLATELGPDYVLMLDPARGAGKRSEQSDALQKTHIAYMMWQPPPKELLQEDLAADQKRLQRWLSAKQFDPDHLLRFVNTRSPPAAYEDYWELPAPISAVASPRIDAACTRKVWEQDLAPFLQQIQDAVPEAAVRLRDFQQRYITNCLSQWQRFLVGFPRGANRWATPDRRRIMAERLLTGQSPARRVIEDAYANLGPWVSADTQDGDPAAWAVPFKRYVGSEQWKAYQEALAAIAEPLAGGAREEAAFKLAQQAFSESEPKADAQSPVLRAWFLASQAGSKPGDVLGPLLREPLLYVWSVLLEDAGVRLQKAWAEEVITPISGLQPAEQVVALYGPGGKVGTFTEQYVKPFVKEDDGTAGTVLDQSVPFSPEFLQKLSEGKKIKPLLEGGSAPEPVVISATRRSAIEGRLTLREEQTVLSVACAGKTYVVSTRPELMAQESVTLPWSYQSCGDVSVSVYLSERGYGPEAGAGAAGKRLQLTKRYGGQTGFLHFLQDFNDGSQKYRIDDLVGADPDTWEILKKGVRAVEVYYDVEVPPALTELVTALQGGAAPADLVAPSPGPELDIPPA